MFKEDRKLKRQEMHGFYFKKVNATMNFVAQRSDISYFEKLIHFLVVFNHSDKTYQRMLYKKTNLSHQYFLKHSH